MIKMDTALKIQFGCGVGLLIGAAPNSPLAWVGALCFVFSIFGLIYFQVSRN